MSKSRNDEAYDKGYKEGKDADYLDRIVHSQRSNSSYDRAHEGGYNDGIRDQYDDDNSHYQGGSDTGGGGCFITTATLISIGKTDNCSELNVFRNYRDLWLAKTNDGRQLIGEYYRIAPEIVIAINKLPHSRNIYFDLWSNDIKPCLSLIENNNYEKAKLVYRNVVIRLKDKYLKS